MKLSIILLTMIFLFSAPNFAINNQDSTKTNTESSLDSVQAIEMANKVLNRYVEAIGGADIIAKQEDRTTIMRGTAMGQPLTFIIKQKAPNKIRQEVKAGGMDQIIIFDGEKGRMEMAEQKMDITGKELEQLKIESMMDLILDPAKYDIKVTYISEDSVDGKLCDQVKYTLPSGIRWFAFFDKETGYKVKEIKELQTKMGLIEQTIKYDDYRDVDGIKFPFKLKQSFGPQEIDMEVSSIKINKGIKDELFQINDN